MSDFEHIPVTQVLRVIKKMIANRGGSTFDEEAQARRQRQDRYEQYLHSNPWYHKKMRVLERAQYLCERCGAANTALEVHHRKYSARGQEDIADLIAVCPRCHLELHHNEG